MQSLKGQSELLTRMQWAILGLMIAVIGGFCAFIYRPQTQRQAALAGQIKQARQELVDAQTQTTMLPAVEADVEQLRLRLEKVKMLPKRDPMDEFVKQIAQITQQSSLKNPVMTRGATKLDDKINEIPVDLKFEGDFNSIFSVLRHTERLKQLTRVPKLDIKATDDQGQVKAELTMNVYYMAD